jgi:SAM-dependent methyltransferase
VSERPIAYPAKPLAFALTVIKDHSPRRWRRAALQRGLKVSRRLFEGDAVECPACGNTAARYARGFCPACYAGSRQRLMALFLRRELGVGAGAGVRILHFAPEPGLIRMLSRMDAVDYVPGDLVPDTDQERVDATDIRLAPTFDGVITSHVLEHIPADAKAMSEMMRVLRPGGWALVIVPVVYELASTYENDAVRTSWGRHTHFGQHDHVRVYGRDFEQRLRAAGFVVDERRYADELPPEQARRYGVGAQDVIYLCRKPPAAAP